MRLERATGLYIYPQYKKWFLGVFHTTESTILVIYLGVMPDAMFTTYTSRNLLIFNEWWIFLSNWKQKHVWYDTNGYQSEKLSIKIHKQLVAQKDLAPKQMLLQSIISLQLTVPTMWNGSDQWYQKISIRGVYYWKIGGKINIFFSTIPNLKLKSFKNKSVETKTSTGKEIILKVDKNLFSIMTIVAQSQQLNMKKVFSHPLGPIPWSLLTADGC